MNNNPMKQKNLTTEQKIRISNMLCRNEDSMLYVAPWYNPNQKVYQMFDHSAAMGDALHIIAHGITIGGLMHSVGRDVRWANIAQNAYNNAISKRLKAYMWNNKLFKFNKAHAEQVVVIGSRFLSVYMAGEICRKDVNFQDIVLIEYNHKNGLILIEQKADGRYYKINICNVFDEMQDLIETILLYNMRSKNN